MYGFKAVECHGNMEQEQRLQAVETFQLGQADFLIGTDLIARGLDISNVKAVINFSFPTEPKRYLHRIGRTARAGQHGVAITLCNEEERKDLKKLTRKLGQNVNTFTIQNKFVDPIYQKVKESLDSIVNDIQCELENEREMKEAMRELKRSENMIKYKDEIKAKPRKEWFQGVKRREEVKLESKKELKSIQAKFNDQLPKGGDKIFKKKRDLKSERKKPAAGKKPAPQKEKPKIFKKKSQLGGKGKPKGKK